MKNKNKADINSLKEIVLFIIQNLHNVKRIILFGSMAANKKGSDIDIALVTTSWDGDIKNLYIDVGKKMRTICQKYPIDFFILPLNILNKYKNSHFLKAINNTGRVLYMDNEGIDEWVDDAKLDYEQSCYLFEGGYYKGACYFAQQSIEKFVKSKLLFLGWELRKVHTLAFLISEMKTFGYTISNITFDDISFMDSIYKGIYPGEQGLLPYGNPSKQDAQKAISIVYRIGTEMGQKLKKLTLYSKDK